MFGKIFYCIFGAMTLVYFNRTVPSVLPPRTAFNNEHIAGERSDLTYVPALITSRTLSFKADSIMQENSCKKHNQRDLGAYDKTGPFSLRPSLDARTRATVLTSLRGFIWEHWYKRSLGRVVSTFYSKEGERITYSFFIEPDENGNWRVAVEVYRLLVTRRGSKGKYSETDRFAADTVERIEVSGDSEKIRTIPKDVPREPESYKLRLIDKKGNVRFEV